MMSVVALCTRYFPGILLLLLAADWPSCFCSPNYIVDVLAVVDKPMFDKWINASAAGTKEKVIAEINSLFFEVNFMYQSLRKYDLNIEIRLRDVLFPNSSIVPSSAVRGNDVWVGEIGKFFTKWLWRNKIYVYDHAMYITKYDLKRSSKNVRGSAAIRAACTIRATSCVEGHLDYETARTVAHELGHSLGSSHDMSQNCTNGYIMSLGNYITSPNRWTFSNCSANAIKRYIKSLSKNNCLVRSGNQPIVSKRMGELLDKTSLCKRLYGHKVSESYAYGNRLCEKLRCSDGTWSISYATPEGLRCNPDKRCFLSQCIYTGY